MAESKLKTPDWIIEGYKSKEEYEKVKGIKSEKKKKLYKLKKCPKCESTEVSVVLGGEEGNGSRGWQCKSCSWKGKDVDEKEMSEDEFIEHLDKVEGK